MGFRRIILFQKDMDLYYEIIELIKDYLKPLPFLKEIQEKKLSKYNVFKGERVSSFESQGEIFIIETLREFNVYGVGRNIIIFSKDLDRDGGYADCDKCGEWLFFKNVLDNTCKKCRL